MTAENMMVLEKQASEMIRPVKELAGLLKGCSGSSRMNEYSIKEVTMAKGKLGAT